MSAIFLDLTGVTYSAGQKDILHGIDLTLTAGRVYGLVGPNGSGKSSLMKIIARQVAPASGRVELQGRPVSEWAGRAFARQVAYMPQFTPDADGMTVRELVALGRFPWHGTLGRFSRTDAEMVERAIARSELDAFADRPVATMSGGERQRAWIAMMLAQDAKCLLLDEPTSALDLSHQASVLSLVRTLSQERGLTVVIVLHDINLAARYCDEIIAMNGGRIITKGTPDEIMRTDMLQRIFGVEIGIFNHPHTKQPVGFLI